MSRIGGQSIAIPEGVDIKINGSAVTVKGKLGQLNSEFAPGMKIAVDAGNITVNRPDDTGTSKALHGLTRALLNNMVTGVSKGFSKTLTIEGVGYRTALKGKSLDFALGYSHPIKVDPPEGITFKSSKPTEVIVEGIDKQKVGQVAAEIRSLRKPEPYKGKGIRYAGEHIKRKAGKAAVK